MAVVIETTLGDITVDLYLDQRPVTCLNFLKLCKMKYYNFNLFHSIRSGFIAQTGDPTGEGSGGQSIFGLLEGPDKRFFSGEKMPKIRHTDAGLLSMVCTSDMMVGSQFFFTLGPDLDSLDGVHCVIGEVTEGHDVLRKLNDVICDETHRPYRDVRITHTVVLEDPFNDPKGLRAPSRSPSPSAERLKGGRIAPDEDIDEAKGKSAAEIQEMIEEKEAKARATILEIVGDLPDADIAPPENVLFVCKLNPVTSDDDLEIIFSRFGKIVSCEVIRDKKSGDSLQYAFIEFADKKSCEDAYFKMDNVLIDDRRIHVDFSQSVSKMKWLGKGRGVKYFNEDGKETRGNNKKYEPRRSQSRDRSRNHQNERNHNNYHRDENRPKDRERDRNERLERQRHERERDSNGKTQRNRSRSRSRLNKPQNDKNNYYADHGKDTKDSERRPKENRTDYHRQERDTQNYSRQSDSHRNDKKYEMNDERRQDQVERNERVAIKERADRKHHRGEERDRDNRKRIRIEQQDVKSERDRNNRDSRLEKREVDREERKALKNNSDRHNKHKNKKAENDDKITPRTPSPVTKKVKQKEKSKKKINKSGKDSKKKNSTKKRRKPSTSSSDSSSDSSSSTESSSSSDSNRKKRLKRRKRKYSTSSTDSSDSSTSSSSSSDSSSSSSSDSDVKRKKKKKHTAKKKKL